MLTNASIGRMLKQSRTDSALAGLENWHLSKAAQALLAALVQAELAGDEQASDNALTELSLLRDEAIEEAAPDYSDEYGDTDWEYLNEIAPCHETVAEEAVAASRDGEAV